MNASARIFHLTILVLLAGITPARGTIIQIRFAGVIDFIENGLPFADDLPVGTPFVGSYAYNSETPDNIPYDVAVGGYIIADYTMQVSIGELEFTTPDLGISVLNSNPPLFDNYGVSNLSSFHANGVDWSRMGITLRDATGLAFINDSLPDYAPDLADFEFATTFNLHQVGQRYSVVTGQLTSLEVFPEPSALALLFTGVLLCARRRGLR